MPANCGNGRTSCWRGTVAPLNGVPGSRPWNGLATCCSMTLPLASCAAVISLIPFDTGRPRVRLPTYDASSASRPGSSRCTPTENWCT